MIKQNVKECQKVPVLSMLCAALISAWWRHTESAYNKANTQNTQIVIICLSSDFFSKLKVVLNWNMILLVRCVSFPVQFLSLLPVKNHVQHFFIIHDFIFTIKKCIYFLSIYKQVLSLSISKMYFFWFSRFCSCGGDA